MDFASEKLWQTRILNSAHTLLRGHLREPASDPWRTSRSRKEGWQPEKTLSSCSKRTLNQTHLHWHVLLRHLGSSQNTCLFLNISLGPQTFPFTFSKNWFFHLPALSHTQQAPTDSLAPFFLPQAHFLLMFEKNWLNDQLSRVCLREASYPVQSHPLWNPDYFWEAIMIKFQIERITSTGQDYDKIIICWGPRRSYLPEANRTNGSQVHFVHHKVVYCSPRLNFCKHLRKSLECPPVRDELPNGVFWRQD